MQETVSCLTDTVLAVYPKVLLSEVATVDDEEDGKQKDVDINSETKVGDEMNTSNMKNIPPPPTSTLNSSRRYVLIQIALSVARAMTPVIRRFLALGMQRQLLR
jgi:hypothetical protein